MGNDGLPISLVIFVLLVLVAAIGFIAALALAVLGSGTPTPAS